MAGPAPGTGGRPRLPDNVKELRGTLKKSRAARRRNVAPAGEMDPKRYARVPPPPAWMAKEAKAVWRQFAPWCWQMGTLDKASVAAFTRWCIAEGNVRMADAELKRAGFVNTHDQVGPWFTVLMKSMTEARILSGQFGIDLGLRARLKAVEPQGEPDAFEQWATKGRSS